MPDLVARCLGARASGVYAADIGKKKRIIRIPKPSERPVETPVQPVREPVKVP